MKRGIWRMRVLVIMLVLLIVSVGVASSQPGPVANTAIADATAHNNGRRMVRDSDDVRHLVYEDSGPFVVYTRSADGITWSTPVMLSGWGRNPSIAIDQGDVLGVVFSAGFPGVPSDVFFICSTDGGVTWSSSFNVSQSPDWNSENPAIATDYWNHWHVVWQEEDEYGYSDIWWRLLYGDCPHIGADPKKDISMTPGKSEFPSIANTIDYSSANVHVVWTDYSEVGYPTPFIAYRTGWLFGTTGWRPALTSPPLDVTSNTTGQFASISVGSDDNPHVVWTYGQLEGDVFHATSPDGGLTFGPPDVVAITGVYFTNPSVANMTSNKLHVTWEDNGEVYHSYSKDDGLTWGPSQLVSQADEIADRDPNLAYKKVLHDFADIVWTRGNSAPYTVMYLRKAAPISAGPGSNTPPDHQRYYDPSASPYNEMLQIEIPKQPEDPPVGNWYIYSITLSASGSGDDKNGIKQVLLIDDANNNGKYDAGETQLATGTYPSDNGTLGFNIAGGHLVLGGKRAHLLVVYNIDWCSVKPGDTFTSRLTAISASYPISGLPFKGATKTIVAPPDTAAVFRVDRLCGHVYADGAFFGAGFHSGSADVAEWVLVSKPVEPGDVLELDPDHPGYYRKAHSPCSNLVAGVVSTDPGVVLDSPPTTNHPPPTDSALLALLGIVPVKVTDEGGPIQSGDLLVCSSTPGYAMRWDPEGGEACGLVGKALEPFDSGAGVIRVLLMR